MYDIKSYYKKIYNIRNVTLIFQTIDFFFFFLKRGKKLKIDMNFKNLLNLFEIKRVI